MDDQYEISKIKARQEISDVLVLYCRALDRLDEDLLRSVYHPDAVNSYGDKEVNAHSSARSIIENLKKTTTYGMHVVAQSIIEINGNSAAGENTYIGQHHIAGTPESLTEFFGKNYARDAEKNNQMGRVHEYRCGGRYLDKYEKRGGVWRILYRRVTNEWGRVGVTNVEKTEGQLKNFDLPGRRDRSDPVYSIMPNLPKTISSV